MSLNERSKSVLAGTKQGNGSRRKLRSLLGQAVRATIDSLEGRRLLANPVADTGGPYVVNEGNTTTIDASASTDDGSITAYAWDLNYKVSKGFRRGVTGRAFSYEAGDSGAPRTIALKVTDNEGNVTLATTTVTVNDVAPTVTLVGAATTLEGQPYALAWSSTDPGQDTITGYSIDWGDGATTAHAATATSATHVYAANDNYTINFTATDEDGPHVTSKDIVVTNVAPVINASLTHSIINEGEQARVNFSSPNRASSIDQWIIDWGDDSVSVRPGSKTFAQHAYARFGTFTVTVTALENDGTATDKPVSITVKNLAPTLTLGGIPNESPEGTAITATRTVTDPGASDTFSYAWELKKGTTVVATSATSGNYTFTPTDNGAYTLKLTVTDNGGLSATQSKSFTVTNVAPTGSVTGTVPSPFYEGTTVQFTANVIDPGSDDTHTFNWRVSKNGNAFALPNGTSVSGRTFNFTPADEGTYIVGCAITDDDGASYIASSASLTVLNANPAASVTGGTNANEGDAQSFHATASDVGTLDTLSYAWTVTKDDAAFALPSEVVKNAANFVFSPSDNGVYVATVTVTDGDGGTVSASSSSFTVANVAPTGVLNVPTTGLTEGNSLSFSIDASDAGALDTFTFAWNVTKNGNPYEVSTPTNMETFAFVPDNEGSYVVSVTVTDKDDASVTKTSSAILVANAAPVATISAAPVDIFEGDFLSFSSTLSDAGANDTAQYLWSVQKDGSDYTLAPGTTVDADEFDFSPTDDGDYVVKLTVTDDAGASSFVTRAFTAANASPLGTISGEPEESVDEGSTLDLAVVVTDAGYEDTFTYEWKVELNGAPVTLPGNANNTSDTFSYVTRDSGTYVVSCVVSDGDGGTHIASSGNIIVANVAPTGTVSGPADRFVTESATLGSNSLGAVGVGFFNDTGPTALAGEHATQGQRFAILKWTLPAGLTTDDVLGATLTLGKVGVVGTARALDVYAFYSDFSTVNASDYDTIAAGGGVRIAQNAFATGSTATIDSTALADAIKAALNDGHNYLSIAVRDASLVNTGVLGVTGIAATTPYQGSPVSSLVIRESLLPPGGDEGAVENFTATPADVGAADTFTYAWSVTKDDSPFPLPIQTSTNGQTFAFTPTDNGSYVVSVVISDDDGAHTTVSTAAITVANVAPTVAMPSPANGFEGSPVTFTSVATDAGSADTLTYSWSVSTGGIPGTPYTLPSDVVTNAPTLTFTPTDQGTYYATVTVTDDDGATTTRANALTVANVAPTVSITGGPTQAVPEGTTITLGTSVTDPGTNDTQSYLWTVSRDGTNPSLNGITTTASSFTYTLDTNGTYVITARVRDKDNGTTYTHQIVTVTNVAPTASITIAPADPVVQGGSATFGVTGQDASPTDVLSYAWHVTRGGVPYVLPNNVVTTSSTFTFVPTFAGNYIVVATVSDSDGASTNATGTLSVGNVAPVINSITEANDASGSVAKHTALTYSADITDPGSEGFSYTWEALRDGEVFDTDTGATYDFTPVLGGEYSVRLTVSDGVDSSETVSAAGFVVVNNAPSISEMTRTPTSPTEGHQISYSPEVSDADGDDLTYAWELSRGGTIVSTATTPNFSYVAPQDGSYSITLIVDDGETTNGVTQEFNVANVAPTAAIANPKGPLFEGTPITLTGSGVDVADDALTYSWTVTGNEATVEGTGKTFGFTPTDDGSYVATLTVSDGVDSTTATRELAISNSVPSGHLLLPTLSGVTGWDSHFSLEDVTRYIGDVVTVDWDWGNGETTLGQSVEAIQTHRWANTGTYNVKATFKDDDGGSSLVARSFTVNDYGMQPDPMGDGLALVVNGGSGNDTITFERTSAGKIKAVRNGVSLGQTFSPTHIIANGDNGANSIVANANVTVPVIFAGGSGKDTLTGGSANDVLMGRKGIDVLNGGAGRDFLIGGADSDFLTGAAGEDILVGGSYASESYTALAPIMNEWGNNSRTFTQRSSRLRNGADGLAALFASGTVIGDGRNDQVTGGTESDWMFKDTFSTADTIVDQTSVDRVDNVAA